MLIFLLDLCAERYVEAKYGVQSETSVEATITTTAREEGLISEDSNAATEVTAELSKKTDDPAVVEKLESLEEFAFRQQIAAFLILEFGVILHSIFVGELLLHRYV